MEGIIEIISRLTFKTCIKLQRKGSIDEQLNLVIYSWIPKLVLENKKVLSYHGWRLKSNFGREMSRLGRPWLPAPCPKFRKLSKAPKDSNIFTVSCMRQLCIIIVIVFFQRSQWLAWLPISPGSPALLSWKSTKIHLRHHNTIVIRLPLDTRVAQNAPN